VYSEAGTYNPELTVVDNDGATSSSTATVTIEEQNQPVEVSSDGDTTEPGGEATVEITIEDGQTIDISDIPSNWSVAGHEDSGGIFNSQIDSGEIGWVWLSGNQDSKSVTVTFEIPSAATTTTVDVVAENSDGNTAETGATVTVESTEQFGFIAGDVFDTENNQISGATVTVEDTSGSVVTETTTDSSGTYTVEVPSGEYTVISESDGLTGEQTTFVEAGVTSTANIVIQPTEPEDGPPAERQLSSTQIAPGGEITVTVQTEAQGDTVAVAEEFTPAVAEASIESVTVNGNSVIPFANAADSTGATVAINELNPGDSAAVEYSIRVSEDAEIGTNYSITGTASSSGGETPIETDEFTVEEVSPLDGTAGEYDADNDGDITASELGSAVTDFGQGELTASELGDVVTAFGQS
jgi:hypothetical protein